jgi:hypothetical protein
VAQRGQVAQYTSGTLLNGGTASTGANGYYYSLVGANTLFTDSAIPESIATITVNSGGSSWNNNGTVTISGGGGSGATATTTRYNTTNVATNSIQNITLGNVGSGYTSLPNVTVSNGSNTGTGATFNVTLKVPEFNTTQLATLLMMDGVTAINTTVAGMSYTDRILLNDTTAYLYKDGNTNVIGQVRQGITRLSTQNASSSLMNTDMNTTVGTTKRSSFASNLTTISSLELFSRVSGFNLDTPLTYADNGVSNAGNITVNGNSSVTLSGASFVSTKAQTYNALLTLAVDTHMNATDVTTNSTLAGGNYNLSINNVAAVDSGNLITGGDSTGLRNLLVTRNSTLNGHVTSSGNQTYNGTLTLGTDANLTASSASATILLNGTINSGVAPRWLNINLSSAGGSTILNSALGNSAALSNLTINATNIALNGASLTTLGDQTYNGSITLGAGTTLLATDANAVITTNGTVNSDATARSLVLNASNTTGRVVVLSALGNTADLASLTVNASAIALNGSSVNTTGSQTFSGNITLGNTVTARASGANAIITDRKSVV